MGINLHTTFTFCILLAFSILVFVTLAECSFLPSIFAHYLLIVLKEHTLKFPKAGILRVYILALTKLSVYIYLFVMGTDCALDGIV